MYHLLFTRTHDSWGNTSAPIPLTPLQPLPSPWAANQTHPVPTAEPTGSHPFPQTEPWCYTSRHKLIRVHLFGLVNTVWTARVQNETLKSNMPAKRPTDICCFIKQIHITEEFQGPHISHSANETFAIFLVCTALLNDHQKWLRYPRWILQTVLSCPGVITAQWQLLPKKRVRIQIRSGLSISHSLQNMLSHDIQDFFFMDFSFESSSLWNTIW